MIKYYINEESDVDSIAYHTVFIEVVVDNKLSHIFKKYRHLKHNIVDDGKWSRWWRWPNAGTLDPNYQSYYEPAPDSKEIPAEDALLLLL